MCGIAGAYSFIGEDIVPDVRRMIKDQENRGQEGCGIAISTGEEVIVKKGDSADGLREKIEGITSSIAIGHTRYSITGSSDTINLQPIVNPNHHFSAIAHNGNLINSLEIKNMLISWGITEEELRKYPSSDTGLIAALIHHDGMNIKNRLTHAMVHDLKGAYSIVITTRTKLIAVRDPWGIRPLFMASIEGGKAIYFASETCAFRLLKKVDKIEEVKPGEMIVVNDKGVHREQVIMPKKSAFCIFEIIYFARPDSYFFDHQVYGLREALGRELAREIKKKVEEESWEIPFDFISDIPDSGTPGSQGLYREMSLPYKKTFIKVRGVRTFIGPNEILRKRSVEEKLASLKDNIKGYKIAETDDSVVRGNTSRKIVVILRKDEAKEVHLLVHSPPIRFPCFYGIDTAEREKLIAADKTEEEVKEFLGADGLHYLSLEGMCRAIPFSDKCCLACFDGKYPAGTPKTQPTKDMLESAAI